MNQRECEDFLESVLEIGKSLLQYGAEAWRVEDTITRICRAYEINKVDVYATTTLLLATIKTRDEIISTQSVRVGRASNNLGGLEAINELSRYICQTLPPISEIAMMRKDVIRHSKMTNYNGLGYVLSAGAFTIFFGGSLIDALVASVIGILIFLADKNLDVKDQNKLIYTLVMCMLTGAIAVLMVSIGFGEHIDKIIIGTVMLYIPSLSLINGVKDMCYRDIITGTFRVIEGVLIAAVIALGFGFSMSLLGGLL